MNMTKKFIEQKYYEEQLDTKQIAKLLNVSSKKVWYYMVKNNMPRRSKKDIGVIDLTNKKFGKLMVIRRAVEAENNRGALWECKCNCGGKKVVRGTSLTSGNTQSCGCDWKTAAYERISGAYWWGIKQNAKKKGLDFTINKKEAWELYIKQNKKCSISHVDIDFGEGLTRKNQIASLDRIDSGKGYVKENIRWVHKDINKMKWDMSDETFFKWIKKIVIAQKIEI